MNWSEWIASLFPPRKPIKPPPPPPPAGTGLSGAMLTATNAARARFNLPPLVASPWLDSAAASHCHEMAASGVMSHAGFPARITAAGYHYSGAAENVAAGQDTAQAVVEAWMDDAPHRANILGPYVHCGGSGAQGRGGTWWWCADYGSPA